MLNELVTLVLGFGLGFYAGYRGLSGMKSDFLWIKSKLSVL